MFINYSITLLNIFYSFLVCTSFFAFSFFLLFSLFAYDTKKEPAAMIPTKSNPGMMNLNTFGKGKYFL